jgi:hypothetical protein
MFTLENLKNKTPTFVAVVKKTTTGRACGWIKGRSLYLHVQRGGAQNISVNARTFMSIKRVPPFRLDLH